jgi:hypothetical protein
MKQYEIFHAIECAIQGIATVKSMCMCTSEYSIEMKTPEYFDTRTRIVIKFDSPNDEFNKVEVECSTVRGDFQLPEKSEQVFYQHTVYSSYYNASYRDLLKHIVDDIARGLQIHLLEKLDY